MIRMGLERTEAWVPLVNGKRVGLASIPASLFCGRDDGITFVKEQCDLTALFGPEHGVRGELSHGVCMGDSKDPVTGISTYSLYQGEDTHLPGDITKAIDILLFDVQDVGLRFYTYIATLKRILEDAAAQALPVIVLDRPDPLGGMVYGSPLPKEDWSFVGPGALPVRYGLSSGELALLFNEGQEKKADLTVIGLEGWNRKMLWPEIGRRWIPTSPAIGSFDSALSYAGFCLLEGTNLSEGRGTTTPFELFGAPYLDNVGLCRFLNGKAFPGMAFVPKYFQPEAGKYAGQPCNGVFVVATDWHANPIPAALYTLWWVAAHHKEFAILPPRKEGAPNPLSRLMGATDATAVFDHPDEVAKRWEEEGREFQETHREVWLYA